MPRISLYQPTKTNDYYFFDRNIKELFDVGGMAAHIHRYIGPAATENKNDASEPNYIDGQETDPITGEYTNPEGIMNETKIQDLLFMENRDRKYDKDIYDLRGIYNVQDNDFDLTQYGFFLSNDALYMNFHLNNMVEIMGRKILAGDVIELPHLRDELLLNADKKAINKYYVVNDANRGAEGFSPTWYPHIWRVKLSPLIDAKEYHDILGNVEDPNSLKNDLSVYKSEVNISDAIIAAADQEDPNGTSLRDHLFGYDEDISGGIVNEVNNDINSNNDNITSGDQFPTNPTQGEYFIRSDMSPKRLFVFRNNTWVRLFDNIRDKTWSDKTYNASDYINNDNISVFNDREFKELQPISKVIKPKDGK